MKQGRWCKQKVFPYPVECSHSLKDECKQCTRKIDYTLWKQGHYDEIKRKIEEGKDFTRNPMIIYLDTETTGLTETDRLIEVAYAVNDKPVISKRFKNHSPIHIEAKMKHHITEKMIAHEEYFENSTTKKKLTHLLHNPENYLIAHNAAFDLAILQKEGINPVNVICSMKIARYKDKGEYDQHNLQYLRYYYEVETEAAAHNAGDDVTILREVCKHILDYNRLEEYTEISKHPVRLQKMPFGKHKGLRFEELDRGYIKWLQGLPDLHEDLRYTIDTL